MSIGKKFLAAVVASGDVSAILQSGPIEHLFRGNEIELFTFVLEFVKQYGSVPKADTILAHTGEELPAPTEPAPYYRDLMEVRHVEIALKNAMKAASEALQPNGAGRGRGARRPHEGRPGARQPEARQPARRPCARRTTCSWGSSTRSGTGGGRRALLLGWPYLDEMTGGMRQGRPDLLCRKAGNGEDLADALRLPLRLAPQAELDPNRPGSSRMFVSMEMNVLPIEQRLAAMHMSIPADQIKKGALSKTGVIKFKKGLKELEGYKAPFWIVDGNLTATVGDISGAGPAAEARRDLHRRRVPAAAPE